MYEELVERLREESEIERWLQPHSANETPKLLDDAADAIEELSKYANYVDTIKRLKSEGWYLQQAKSHEGCNAIATMQLPEPPKEET